MLPVGSFRPAVAAQLESGACCASCQRASRLTSPSFVNFHCSLGPMAPVVSSIRSCRWSRLTTGTRNASDQCMSNARSSVATRLVLSVCRSSASSPVTWLASIVWEPVLSLSCVTDSSRMSMLQPTWSQVPSAKRSFSNVQNAEPHDACAEVAAPIDSSAAAQWMLRIMKASSRE